MRTVQESILLFVPGLLIAAAFCAIGVPTVARATVIIGDDFGSSNGRTVTNGENVQGLTPDLADLPSGTYTSTTQNLGNNDGAQITTAAGNPSPSVDVFFNTSVSIPYNGNGYTAPSIINISADFAMESIGPGDNDERGEGLGFYSSALSNPSESNVGFTGVLITPSGGLQLEVDGTVQGSIASAPSGWTTTNFYNLNYTVDTATGQISSVIFDGQDFSSTFSSTTAFSGSNVNLVGFYGSAGNGTTRFGYVDSFQVSTVPEPGTFGLATLVSLATLSRRRRA